MGAARQTAAALVGGLRGRLLAALLLTSAVTLAVAAVALLSPLERRLRREEVKSLQDTAVAARPGFRQLPDDAFHSGDARLTLLAEALERRTGARVAIFDGQGRKLADTEPRTPFGPVPQTRDDERPHGNVVVNSHNADVARVAMPLTIADHRAIVALRKPLDNVRTAAGDVRVAFTKAALAGLGIALLLAVGIASTLLRRLRRLRTAALDVAEHGLSADVPADRSHDEVGDLARAFARMQSRLQHQEQARRSFVSTASHELRTPLASLQGMLELLQRDLEAAPPDLGDARAQAHQAEEQARRLNGLASDLLDLTRLDAEVELRSEPVELRELCRAVIAEFAVRVDPGRIELAPGDPDVQCWATADPGSVARVVRILLDNALRLSPASDPVVVTAGSAGGLRAIAVEDRGPGVPPEERELIFERFSRGSNRGPDGGFGLGLAIGRELARRMHGDLVLAERPGRGARFELRLTAAEIRVPEPAPVPA